MRILNMEWVRHCRSSSSACPHGSLERWWSPRRGEIFKGNCPCTYFACCSILLQSVFPYLLFSQYYLKSQTPQNSFRKCNIDPTFFMYAVTTDFRLKKNPLIYFLPRMRYPYWMCSAFCSCLILIGVLKWKTRVSSTLNANQDQRKLARPITIAL